MSLGRRSWFVAFAAGILITALAPTTATATPVAPTGWTVDIGGGDHLDYSVASAVVASLDGAVYVAGYSTTSFSADTAITGFDLFVQRMNLDGTVEWARTLAPIGGGLPRVDLTTDGLGNVWLVAGGTDVFGFDEHGATLVTGIGPLALGENAEVRGAAEGGLLLADPDTQTIWSVAANGTQRWSASLPANTATVDLVSLQFSAFVMACIESGPTISTTNLVIDAAGSITSSGVGLGRFAADSLIAADPTKARHVDLANTTATEASCTDEPASVGPLQTWTWFPPPLGEIGPTHTLSTSELSFAAIEAGGIIRVHPDDLDVAAVMRDDGGQHFITRSTDSGSETIAVESDQFIDDVVFLPTGAVVMVGVEFGIGSTDPGEPFNAQGFVRLLDAPDEPASPDPPVGPGEPPFVDVTAPWQQEPVSWAWRSGVTEGIDAQHFAPDRDVTRAEVAAMLHRLRGAPTPGLDHPFVDVDRLWQNDPVTWLWANDVTQGVDATHFAPDRSITRGEVVTMLYRLNGRPSGDGPHPFNDIELVWQELPVRWAFGHGVTVGVNLSSFAPERPITRGEFVTMLYRTTLTG